MKAIVHRRYGSPDVLECVDIEKPGMGDNEVLIRVRAASLNPLDWHFLRGIPYPIRLMGGMRVPKDVRLGVDVAGEVEAVGRLVTEFKPGDAVFGSCRGAFAEYACAAASAVAAKPDAVTFEQACTVGVAATTALQALRDTARVGARQRVLVNGAAGGVGTFAVQLGKWLGAEVTGVCSGRNLEMVRSIGASRVVDYTREDFARTDDRYDAMLDCVGNRTLGDCCRALKPKGTYVVIGGPPGRWMSPLDRVLKARALSPFVGQKLTGFFARAGKEDLRIVGDLIADRTVTPVIDRRYPLADVPAAIRYLEEGHARGKIVIAVASSE